MGGTTCLVQAQTFSCAPGLPNTASESKPMHAFGQSISFGRFMSESLDWEKWSAFNSNPKRYVEEAERYSRPGSVAQKKAFFEAHYKKISARKVSNNSVETEEPVDYNTAAIQDTLQASSGESHVLNSGTEAVVKDNGYELYDLNIEGNAPKRESVALESENKVCAWNSTLFQPEDNDNHLEKDEEQNSNSVPEEMTLITKEKPSAVSSENNGTPSSPTLPAILGAPISSTNKVDAYEKKRTTPKSPFMSVNFSSLRKNRLTATVMKKIKSSRVYSSSSRISEVCPTQRTPTMAFENESVKYNLVAPSTMSTHLRSRTEERTARRKKETARSVTWNLGQAFCFKARPLPEFHEERKEIKECDETGSTVKFEQFNKETSTRSVLDHQIFSSVRNNYTD